MILFKINYWLNINFISTINSTHRRPTTILNTYRRIKTIIHHRNTLTYNTKDDEKKSNNKRRI